jgi:hypothetical protein
MPEDEIPLFPEFLEAIGHFIGVQAARPITGFGAK